MIARIRLTLVIVRPAVLYLLLLYAALGAEIGGGADSARMVECALAIAGFLMFSVAVTDLADERIDRINLSGDRRRPLVVGSANRSSMATFAVAGAIAALAGATAIAPSAGVITGCGLLVSAGYSMRPLRLADRGVIAPLVLPACYVAIPYLDGLAAADAEPSARSMVLLGGLYVGFVGRIMLKDFRDVRGDRLFGKRTFLVRHGRRTTCIVAGLAWTVGTAVVAFTQHSATFAVVCALAVGGAWSLLDRIASDPHPRRDEWRISAMAILGRATMVTLLCKLYTQRAGWTPGTQELLIGGFAVLTGWLMVRMLRYGPKARLTSADIGAASFTVRSPAAEVGATAPQCSH